MALDGYATVDVAKWCNRVTEIEFKNISIVSLLTMITDC